MACLSSSLPGFTSESQERNEIPNIGPIRLWNFSETRPKHARHHPHSLYGIVANAIKASQERIPSITSSSSMHDIGSPEPGYRPLLPIHSGYLMAPDNGHSRNYFEETITTLGPYGLTQSYLKFKLPSLDGRITHSKMNLLIYLITGTLVEKMKTPILYLP